ncbi:hypothetical protein [Maribellus maritimus]|uniref:hypothetical protein n=1 Tax=Maribellus maritimus TaxID=2870838 RepID=UPI001EE9BE56|nr:hypothetical protein [Maribellus maritimus]MCG6187116.1 hypothetical protein [Maribellus maritimus]
MKPNSVVNRNWAKKEGQLQYYYRWLNPGDLSNSNIDEDEFLNNLQLKTGKKRKQLPDELNTIIQA